MNTTPIEKCSIGPDAELTVRLATEKGWSRFLIFPNGNLIGTSPDGVEDEPVPNFGRMLKEAAPDLLEVVQMLLEDFDRPLSSMGLRLRVETIDKARAAIAKAKGE